MPASPHPKAEGEKLNDSPAGVWEGEEKRREKFWSTKDWKEKKKGLQGGEKKGGKSAVQLPQDKGGGERNSMTSGKARRKKKEKRKGLPNRSRFEIRSYCGGEEKKWRGIC